MNIMKNINMVVTDNDTKDTIITKLCDKVNLSADDPFAFSCIMTRKDKSGNRPLKINRLEPYDLNPYTIKQLINQLFKEEKEVQYVVAPLEQYLTIYRPMLLKMVNKAYPIYANLIPEKEELMSILFLAIVKLNDKNYYLHNRLIYRSFINELNLEVRKLKHGQYNDSLDRQITIVDNEKIKLSDLIEDPTETERSEQLYKYTIRDYWEDMFNDIKSAMLDDMSQFSFDRILIQLDSKTIDSATSRTLRKYREEFNPGYVLRPNARKGGKNVQKTR